MKIRIIAVGRLRERHWQEAAADYARRIRPYARLEIEEVAEARLKDGASQAEEKKAVECGYWTLYRFNPTLADAGKNPFSLDSKEPSADFKDFLMGEVRYSSLAKQYPEQAEALFAKTERDAKERLETYKRLAKA